MRNRSHFLSALARLLVVTLALVPGLRSGAHAGQTIDLATIAADLRVLGESASGNLGYDIAAGDIDGDGDEDIIVGAPNAAGGVGRVYVIAGSATPTAEVDLAAGGATITITGEAVSDLFGRRVSCADVNGDGVDDIVMSAPLYDPSAPTRVDNGRVYILYGGDSLDASYTASVTTMDVVVTGAGAADGDNLGEGLATGDVNGDGIDDLLIGAPRATASAGDAGRVFILYGGSLPSSVDLAGTTADVEIWGAAFAHQLGSSIATGDINGDDIDDLVGVALNAAPKGRTGAGAAYVVYGADDLAAKIDLFAGAQDVVIEGAVQFDGLGQSVAVGDLDHDGYDDIAIGAANASPPGRAAAGIVYVLKGGGLPVIVDLGNPGTEIVTLYGAAESDALGWSARFVNYNGDGLEDLLIGAPAASFSGGIGVGRAYLIAGDPLPPALIDLATDDADLTILGDDEFDLAAFAVAGGDVNGDGVDDLLVAAPWGDPGGADAGEVYALFGTTPYLELSAPDTTATYAQALQVPVRVDTTTLFKMVHVEIDLLLDSQLLTYNGLLQAGTLTEGWTFDASVIPGDGSDLDTLRIAGATAGPAGGGTGDLLYFGFTVANVRHAASSPLTLHHLAFNGTRPEWTPTTDGSVVLVGHDGRVQTTVVVEPGDTMRVRAVDLDRNLDPLEQDSFAVEVVSALTGERESVLLTELSVDDSVFFGQLPTTPGTGAGVDGDGELQLDDGDSLATTFVDSLDAAGATVDRLDTCFALLPLGDVDGSGATQAFDAARILAHAAGLLTLTGPDSLTANLDALAPAGPINAFDAALVIQHRLGKRTRFPVQAPDAANHPQPETAAAAPRAAPRPLTVRLGDDGALELHAEARQDIVAADLVLHGVDRLLGVRPASDLVEAQVVFSQKDGRTRIGLAAAEAARGPGLLLRLLPAPDAARVAADAVRLVGTLNGTIAVTSVAATTGSSLPRRFALLPNHPNPFNAETQLPFQLPSGGQVELAIYNAVGQPVRTLVRDWLPAGEHTVAWDGTDDAGSAVASGTYVAALRASGTLLTRGLLLLK